MENRSEFLSRYWPTGHVTLIADMADGEVIDSLLSSRFSDDDDASTADGNLSGDESVSIIAERILQKLWAEYVQRYSAFNL
jgi:hypothetical protein